MEDNSYTIKTQSRLPEFEKTQRIDMEESLRSASPEISAGKCISKRCIPKRNGKGAVASFTANGLDSIEFVADMLYERCGACRESSLESAGLEPDNSGIEIFAVSYWNALNGFKETPFEGGPIPIGISEKGLEEIRLEGVKYAGDLVAGFQKRPLKCPKDDGDYVFLNIYFEARKKPKYAANSENNGATKMHIELKRMEDTSALEDLFKNLR